MKDAAFGGDEEGANEKAFLAMRKQVEAASQKYKVPFKKRSAPMIRMVMDSMSGLLADLTKLRENPPNMPFSPRPRTVDPAKVAKFEKQRDVDIVAANAAMSKWDKERGFDVFAPQRLGVEGRQADRTATRRRRAEERRGDARAEQLQRSHHRQCGDRPTGSKPEHSWSTLGAQCAPGARWPVHSRSTLEF